MATEKEHITTIIVPAYNETNIIKNLLNKLIELEYHKK